MYDVFLMDLPTKKKFHTNIIKYKRLGYEEGDIVTTIKYDFQLKGRNAIKNKQ